MRHVLLALISAVALPATTAAMAADGDARRGAAFYRACVGCHSLEPGVHLTGPSLAGLWGRPAGQAEGFGRYSSGLKAADFRWNEDTLNAWLADPQAMIPGTYMVFRGIDDGATRADLVALLERALAPGGLDDVVGAGLIPAAHARGQQPEPLAPAPDEARVTAIRHCGDSYFVTTADGRETPYWELNVRLKVDSRATGPEPGKPAIARSGMMGDRVSIVFSGVDELRRSVVEQC